MSFSRETVKEPQQEFSANSSPKNLSNQQSRRGSIFDIQQSRVSNQILVVDGTTGFSDKYLHDSFETENLSSNQTSSNVQSRMNESRIKGPIQYYDELQLVGDKDRDETSQANQEDPSMYEFNELNYNQFLQEFDQTNENQAKLLEHFHSTHQDYSDQKFYESKRYGISSVVLLSMKLLLSSRSGRRLLNFYS